MNEAGKISFSRNAEAEKHLDAFSLINMLGRVYDPVIGYFTTPDDFVHNPNYYNNYEINTNYSYTTSPDPVQNVDATEAMKMARGKKDDGVTDIISDWWNNHWTAKFIPDVIYINMGINVSTSIGWGYSTGYALQIRGKEGFGIRSYVTIGANMEYMVQ